MDNIYYCSAVATRSLVEKKENPRAFTIHCTIGSFNFAHALCDLGASINLISFAVFKQLVLGAPKPTTMILVMVDRTVIKSVDILYDIFMKVASFIFLVDFMILNCEVNFQVPIIMRRPFLDTGRTLIDLELGHLMLRLNDEQVIFNVCKSMRQPNELRVISMIDVCNEEVDSFHDVDAVTLWDDGSDMVVPIEERLGLKHLQP
ncbi:uncharacterized protein LOC124899489 [Capsicum annuum]|uniref:uncharacterized protein LOC124899489 n=1 Tax=Capsicum annuum TaxID=4072 RepID=UPI001FB189C3|nr:uncharacterized protein LOC124899489 [Capsicum annuum]